MVSALPSQLGRYKILDEIGRGAMGVVYLARDPLIGRLVALKTFRISAALSGSELETFRARFIREAQSAGILSHPNIVTIHDVVEESEEGATFIAMEYVRGADLKGILAKERKLELDTAVDIVGQVAEGLDYAHSSGVVHRDVKPANILITEDRQVKLTDFGIARIETSNLTMEGQLLGTPNYMAPEQIQGLDSDHRVDVFSLGVVLYEMLTGEKPFKGENVTVVTHRIVYDEYTAPEEYVGPLPEPVMEVLSRALAKEPEDRFETVAGMAEALRSGVARIRTQSELNETQAVTPVPPPGAVEEGAAGPATATGGTRAGTVRPGPGVGARLAAAARGTGAALASAGRSLGSLARREPSGGDGGHARGQAAGGKGASNLPSATRLALVAGVTLAVGVILAGLLLAAVRDGDDLAEATRPSPEHEQRVAVHPYLMAAAEQLREGDPAAALAYLEVAQQVGPDLRGVKVRRQQVERQAGSLDELEEHAEVVARGLVQARIAAEAGQWRAAREAARSVLEVEPDNEEAAEIVERAGAGLAAEARRREQEARERAAREAEERLAAMQPDPEPEPDPEPALPEPTGESTLELYFFTELPEGTLTLYLDGQQIARESFRFYDRKFLRQVPSQGAVENEYTVEPGEATLRIIVALGDRPPINREIQANFPDGARRRLDLRLREDFSLEVDVD
jgi:predicted Ser/Thr protein kinase